MDVLDKYKKAWENQPEDSQKVSRDEIFKMTHARSSSIVKWIFIIGLLEVIILNLSYFFFDMEKVNQEYKQLGLENFMLYTMIVLYSVILYFLFKFYMNYKSISVIDNTKELMSKILKTRKTVKYYVLFNLGSLIPIVTVILTATIIQNKKGLSTNDIIYYILLIIIVCIVMLSVLWAFYQLLYGILLRKLNRNYKELAKLGELN